MEVQIREKCPHCENGMVANWIWQEFYKWEKEVYQAEHGEHSVPEMDEVDQWFRDRGYATGKYLPKEEVPCSECEGESIIFRWVPLEELFSLAHPIISKHWTPEKEPVTA